MRTFVNGDTMLDLQKKDGRFPLALQDVQWKEPQDIVTVFDLASGETVLEAKAVQELEAKACESTGPVVEIVDDEPSAKTATTEPMSRKRKHRRGRKQGERDWSFSEWLRIIRFAVSEKFIRLHKSGRMVNNLVSGLCAISIPWTLTEAGDVASVAVDTVLEWQRQSVQQRWEDMIQSEELCKKLGEDWHCVRSRLPNHWRQVLNDTDSLKYRMLGQPRLLDKFPQLANVLQKTDAMHKDEREMMAPASTQGFLETLKTNLQLEVADDGEVAHAY